MGISCKSVQSSLRSTFNNFTMKFAIVFAILFCSPAFAQLDIGRIIGNFRAPFQCDQCPKAFTELASQVCTEIENGLQAPFDLFKQYIKIKDLCMKATALPGSIIVNTACQPFGLCKGQGPVVDCNMCPMVMRGFITNSICGFIPPLYVVDGKGICMGIMERLKDSDYEGLCKIAGFCPQ